ncbi:MAG: hypothetical protein KKG49_01785, partial [Gammaproteobacteria bacterium]|nr:hypothetical protein [Gammaproteobacteria bacterium]
MEGLVVQRWAGKQKAAGETGRLFGLQRAEKEGRAKGLPNVMNPLCTSPVTGKIPPPPAVWL